MPGGSCCFIPLPNGMETGTENWGTLYCPPHPHRLASSLAPRAGRVHSWSSVVRVLIRRLLLPGLWGRGLGHWGRQTDS